MSDLTTTGVSLDWLGDDDMPENIEDASEQIKTISGKGVKSLAMAYWNIGKIIQHIKEQYAADNDDSSRGSGAVETLSQNTDINIRTLYCCNKLFIQHPTTEDMDKVAGLDWSILRALQQIGDSTARSELEEKALEENWSAREAEKEVKEFNSTPDVTNTVVQEMILDTPEPEPEPDPAEYFEKLEQSLRTALTTLQQELTPAADMKAILDDPNALSEEDFEQTNTHITNCLELGQAIVTFCTTHVVESFTDEE
jgi:hypothetical protein